MGETVSPLFASSDLEPSREPLFRGSWITSFSAHAGPCSRFRHVLSPPADEMEGTSNTSKIFFDSFNVCGLSLPSSFRVHSNTVITFTSPERREFSPLSAPGLSLGPSLGQSTSRGFLLFSRVLRGKSMTFFPPSGGGKIFSLSLRAFCPPGPGLPEQVFALSSWFRILSSLFSSWLGAPCPPPFTGAAVPENRAPFTPAVGPPFLTTSLSSFLFAICSAHFLEWGEVVFSFL